MIRIGIDAHGVGGNSLGCGNETHFAGLIRALLRIDSKNEYHVFVNQLEAFEKLSSRHPNAKVVRLRPRSQWLQRPISLPRYAWKHRLDVIHCPFVPPPFVSAARIITVHDIAFETHPEWYTPVEALRMKLLVRNGCRIADRIFTVSHFAARQLRDTYGVPEEKLVVTYNAVEAPATSANVQPQPEAWGQAPFLLYLGVIQPRKNLSRLIEAFECLVERYGLEHHLVIAGKNGWRTEDFDESLRKSPIRHRIHRLGYVPGPVATSLLARASAFVFPSLFEGFGIPVLEAQSAGTPAVVASSSCFPEVFGDSVQYCDPAEPESIARAVREVVCDEQLRARLIARGAERAQLYSWDRTAATVLDSYLGCVQQHKRGASADVAVA
jgi:glycosyltransferase involved in cell wall biosynthesis